MLAFTRSQPQPPLDAHAELIVADSDDELVPFGATVELPATPLPTTPSTTTDTSREDRRLLRQWMSDTGPWFGWRRVLWFVTGIDLGPSPHERRLRLVLCELLDADQSDQPTSTDEAEGSC